jgi:predicted nucleic acid-binding protein
VPYLVNTSVLARLANSADVSYAIAVRAVVELHSRGEELRISPQNLIEFRSVATRPIAANGLGLSSMQATAKSSIFEAAFALLEDHPGIYPAWKGLVAALGVIGKQVHDARLVAICHVHGVSHLLSFNAAHFIRMSTYGAGLAVVHPASV